MNTTGWTHNPAQDQEMRQLLAGLEIISHGETSKLDRTGGESERVMPPGEAHPDHDYWRRKYEQAETDDDREQVIRAARIALADIKKRAQTPASAIDPEKARLDRICSETIGVRDIEVAHAYGLTLARVHKARRQRNLDPLDGRGDVQAEVLRLHKEEKTIRFIAMRVGLAPSSVHKIVKAARDA